MMKHEFEKLAMRGDATIGPMMYESVEWFYGAYTEYHEAHGGIDESKKDFVKRVFGGKVNTPRSIARKLTEESIRENRYALRGTSVTEESLKEMDDRIREQYEYLYTHNL